VHQLAWEAELQLAGAPLPLLAQVAQLQVVPNQTSCCYWQQQQQQHEALAALLLVLQLEVHPWLPAELGLLLLMRWQQLGPVGLALLLPVLAMVQP
jgi:hypothetical protein